MRLGGLKIVRNTLKIAISSLEIHLSDAVERQRPGAARAEPFCAGGQAGTRGCHQHRQRPQRWNTRCHGASARRAKLGPGSRTHRPSQKWQIINQGLGLPGGSGQDQKETGWRRDGGGLRSTQGLMVPAGL